MQDKRGVRINPPLSPFTKGGAHRNKASERSYFRKSPECSPFRKGGRGDLVLTLFFTLLTTCISAQTFQVCGTILDEFNAPVPGVNVYDSLTLQGVATGANGQFCLTHEAGQFTLVTSSVAMESWSARINLTQDTTISVYLKPVSHDIGEVTVTGQAKQEASPGVTGQSQVTQEQIELLPEFLGESDALRAMQMTAGVSSSTEGVSGLIVRGGAVDQNLFLIDNAVVYNPTHLSGLFSVVNADIMQGAELYKGILPARFGGRGSSVIDIGLQQGQMDSALVKGSIGLLTSKVYASTPLIKRKMNVQLSIRKTYIDELVSAFRDQGAEDFVDAGYDFQDGTAKITYLASEKDLFSLTMQHNRDAFRLSSEGGVLANDMVWANNVAVLNHKHRTNNGGSWDSYACYSGYDFEFDAALNSYGLTVLSGITDWSAGTMYQQPVDSSAVWSVGLHYVHHDFLPNDKMVTSNDGEFDFEDGQHILSEEIRPYVGWQDRLDNNWDYSLAFHGTGYHQIGPFDYYQKQELHHVTDTTSSGVGFRFNRYYKVSPRLTVGTDFNDSLRLNMGISRNYQFVHMASISSVSFPADFWFPTTYGIPPQAVDQVNVEVLGTFGTQAYCWSVGTYYKAMDNMLEYQYGMLGNFESYNLSDDILLGKGRAFGLELELAKQYGDFTGQISYALARTLRQFGQINDGEEFPAKYDHPHDLSLYLAYDLNDRISFSGAFIYTSGNNMTVPASRYIIQEGLINTYNPKNGFRMPAYHRADLAMTLKNKPEKKFRSTWKFSVYNAYNRPNPYLIFFTANGDLAELRLRVRAKQITLFPLLPSISWKFEI